MWSYAIMSLCVVALLALLPSAAWCANLPDLKALVQEINPGLFGGGAGSLVKALILLGIGYAVWQVCMGSAEEGLQFLMLVAFAAVLCIGVGTFVTGLGG